MIWLYVIVAVAGIVAVLLFLAPNLKATAAKIVEVPQFIPLPSMPQLPTEIKVSLPEIQFPEIVIPAFPELPDFEKIVNNILDALPDAKEDIIDPITETIPDFEKMWKDFMDKMPTIEDAKDAAKDVVKDVTPKWVKDPIGYVKDAVIPSFPTLPTPEFHYFPNVFQVITDGFNAIKETIAPTPKTGEIVDKVYVPLTSIF